MSINKRSAPIVVVLNSKQIYTGPFSKSTPPSRQVHKEPTASTALKRKASSPVSSQQPPKLLQSQNKLWPQMCIQIIFQMYAIYLTVQNGFLGKQMSKFSLASEHCTCHGLWSQNHCPFSIRSWQVTMPAPHSSEGPKSQRSKIL